ncbi:EthD family reductase [Geodermatophilus sp. URMC 60]
MFTVSFVLYEKAGTPREEALRYWREQHGPIVAQVPGLRRYVQQHAVAAPEGEPPFLGLAWISFDDQESFTSAAAGPEFAAAVADVSNFADETRLPTAFVEEVTILG